jgi:hypothetical protein
MAHKHRATPIWRAAERADRTHTDVDAAEHKATMNAVSWGDRENQLEQPYSITRTINVNFDEMREIVAVSIRRASSFLRLGLDDLETRDGGDFNLTAGVQYRFWPAVISAQDRDGAREEYRSWLVGSCLRELDLFYGLFLDRVWWAIEVGEIHGTPVPSGFMFDAKFARITNVASKQRQVAEKLGSADHYEELNSLSLARNTLAHNAGVVRSPVDCNNAARDALEVKWLAFDMLATRGGEERVVDKLPFDTNELPGEGETQIEIRFTQRVLSFPAKSRVGLSLTQLAELCLFYKIIADKTIKALLNHYCVKGLIAHPED